MNAPFDLTTIGNTDDRDLAPYGAASANGHALGTSVLELHDVTKRYASTPPVCALAGVNLTVQRGEFVAIVGPSGSGKSTLLNVIGLLDRATEGTVRVAGRNVASLTDAELSALRALSIGFVFQQFHLVDGLRAIDNVAMGIMYRGTARRERLERARSALESVGLAHRLDHRPSTLSGGERQRVAIARAIVGEPAIVLADEPTGNLDSRSGGEIIDLLRALHAAGSTIVLITHDLSIAKSVPRVVSIRDGAIVHDGAWS
ncbi:MAG TPA: ABC transporter ATP-binding protein [Acidimicrobiales bacterium]|jgi:putative ABC transport system ATP-binding protein|nr:ABC transporter ATP-binding protein [Acidimicrobiales bacterium]